MKSGIAIGVDLGGTNLKMGLVSENGDILFELNKGTNAQAGPEFIFSQIEKGIADLLEKVGEDAVNGIGVGVPGTVYTEKGIVSYPPNLPGWKEEPVRDRFRSKFNVPVFVENDANVAALAEKAHGAGKGANHLICITLGTGVGSGLILNGKLYHGAVGAAGEFGHTTINYEGPRCNCGNYGCIERYVGAQSIVERALNKFNKYPDSTLKAYTDRAEEITPKLINQLAAAGDRLSEETLRETGELLGIALVSVVNLLNLELIVIAGGIANAGEILFEPIRQKISRLALPLPGQLVKVVKAQMGDRSGVIGAAHLVFENN
ncbi:glucokinase [bacterium BMS3Abin05]|nr:glucokinase [bacterium BMS3Abin05]GBE28422.1 glucokinase [bacterium BMS3Bbin03]HDZ12871.1 ROK family protein [Bacteroidota bacterium]